VFGGPDPLWKEQTNPVHSPWRKIVTAFSGVLLLAVSCSTPGAETPLRRIVSLSPSATEILFAIGAGDQVVAVDGLSDFPPEAKRKADDDLVAINPNIDDIMNHSPNLVILTEDVGTPEDKGISIELRKRGVEVFIEKTPSGLDEVYAEFHALGAETEHVSEARAKVREMRGRIANIVAMAPKPATERRYFHEVDTGFYTATSKTFIGSIYAIFNLRNIADGFDTEGNGYPKLTSAQIISEDPEFIFLADAKCCGQNFKTVRARKGWSKISAVRNGRVIELDDDLASRWGPRLTDLLERISTTLSQTD
jgi:iron complex transport system substrate-binding protein